MNKSKSVKEVTKEERELSNQIRAKIDAIINKTHFKQSKVAEILGIKQTTNKTNRSKGLLTQVHLDEVICYFTDYNDAMDKMNKMIEMRQEKEIEIGLKITFL